MSRYSLRFFAVLAAVTTLAAAAQVPAARAAPAPPSLSALPDWSGVWESTGSLFDQSHGQTNPNSEKARDYPPYNPEWEARYVKFLNEVVWAGKFVDPITLCLPGGFPRIMSAPRGTAFVARPEMTVIIKEQGWVRYIYTDGRDFPPADERWPSWEGWSKGHWEGDTLVVETLGMRGKMTIDRTGLTLSDQAHTVERIRRVDANTMEDQFTITDPVAFTKPWTVVRRWTRHDPKTWMAPNNCSESQHNPIVNGQNTVVLAADVPKNVGNYPADIAPFAVP